MSDNRLIRFEWWHDAVFGPKPIEQEIPHEILRDYLDYEWEMLQARKRIEQ